MNGITDGAINGVTNGVKDKATDKIINRLIDRMIDRVINGVTNRVTDGRINRVIDKIAISLVTVADKATESMNKEELEISGEVLGIPLDFTKKEALELKKLMY